jgi:hypothetical protein
MSLMDIDENSMDSAAKMGEELAVVEYTKKSIISMGRSMSITQNCTLC